MESDEERQRGFAPPGTFSAGIQVFSHTDTIHKCDRETAGHTDTMTFASNVSREKKSMSTE